MHDNRVQFGDVVVLEGHDLPREDLAAAKARVFSHDISMAFIEDMDKHGIVSWTVNESWLPLRSDGALVPVTYVAGKFYMLKAGNTETVDER